MEIVHDIERHRFTATLAEGHGEIVYRQLSPELIDILHTEVDPALRGRGVADALTEAMMGYALEQHATVIPTCPFVQQWLQRHPEWRTLLDVRLPKGSH